MRLINTSDRNHAICARFRSAHAAAKSRTSARRLLGGPKLYELAAPRSVSAPPVVASTLIPPPPSSPHPPTTTTTKKFHPNRLDGSTAPANGSVASGTPPAVTQRACRRQRGRTRGIPPWAPSLPSQHAPPHSPQYNEWPAFIAERRARSA